MSTEMNPNKELEGILFDSERKYVVKPLVPAVVDALRNYTKTDSNEDLGALMGIKSGGISISQMKNQRHPLRLPVEKLQNLAGNLNVSFEKIVDILRERILFIEDTSPNKEKLNAFLAGLQSRAKLFSSFDFEPKLNGKKDTFMGNRVVPIEWLNLIPDHSERISLIVDHCGKSSNYGSNGKNKEESPPRQKRKYRKKGQAGDDAKKIETGGGGQISGQPDNDALSASAIFNKEDEGDKEAPDILSDKEGFSGGDNQKSPPAEPALDERGVSLMAKEIKDASESSAPALEEDELLEQPSEVVHDDLRSLIKLVATSAEIVAKGGVGEPLKKDEPPVAGNHGSQSGEKNQETPKSKEGAKEGTMIFESLRHVKLLNAISLASQNVGEAKRSKLGMCADVFLGTLSRQMSRRNYTVIIEIIKDQYVAGGAVVKGVVKKESSGDEDGERQSVFGKDKEITLITFKENNTGDSFCWKVDIGEFLTDRLEVSKKTNGGLK